MNRGEHNGQIDKVNWGRKKAK